MSPTPTSGAVPRPELGRPPRSMRAGRGGGAGPGALFSGKECLAGRGRPRPPKPCKPRRPPRASFTAALKPSSRSASPDARRVRRLTHSSPPTAASRPLPATIRRSPTFAQSWGQSPKRVRVTLLAGVPQIPSPRRRGAPSPPRAARPLPPLPRSITQKLVKLVPDSWRRAPLQERKKGKRKREKAGAREREG